MHESWEEKNANATEPLSLHGRSSHLNPRMVSKAVPLHYSYQKTRICSIERCLRFAFKSAHRCLYGRPKKESAKNKAQN